MLEICENRRVLFDNKTKDAAKKAEQLQQLLSLVNDVVMKNGGKPFSNDLFVEFKVRFVGNRRMFFFTLTVKLVKPITPCKIHCFNRKESQNFMIKLQS